MAEFPLRDAEALHAHGVHEEEGLAAELGRGHEGVADLAGDGQSSLLFVDLEDDLVADAEVEVLAGQALDADAVALGQLPSLSCTRS